MTETLDILLTGGRVLVDGALRDGLALGVTGDRIAWLGPQGEAPPARRITALDGDMLLPGFIDVQVNGGGGALFNDAPTRETIAAIGRAHYQYGTTGFLPTLISDHLDLCEQGIAAVSRAMADQVPGVLGIHIEGPFLNPQRRGIHDANRILTPTRAMLERVIGPAGGRNVITLAPEVVSPGDIAWLTARGMRVCAGHSEASADQTRAALAEGLHGFTHLFNAMPPLINRAPGIVGAALEDPRAWCGLIVDGVHVDPMVLRLALRCRPSDSFMLVTDAMPPVGTAMREFTLNGHTVQVENGRCTDARGTLAGSALDMAGAVRNAVALLGLPLPQAVAMASANPAAFLGLDGELGQLAKGYRASFVRADDGLLIRAAWIDGLCVFGAEPLRAT